MSFPRCNIPFWWLQVPLLKLLAGWLLMFGVPSRRTPSPLHWLWQSRCENETSSHAILREEELFHHSLSPHPERAKRPPLTQGSQTPINHLLRFLSTDPPGTCFRKLTFRGLIVWGLFYHNKRTRYLQQRCAVFI